MRPLLIAALLCLMAIELNANPTKVEEREITRKNVTWKEANPRRVKADHLFYLRLGGGGTIGADLGGSGAAFGLGYRYETDRFAVDVSGGNTVLSLGGENIGADVDFLRLSGLLFFDPISDYSFYAGLGISYGATIVNREGEDPKWNLGVRGNPFVGFEMMRTSTVRLFIQVDAALPFYKSSDDSGDEEYTPSVFATLGIGW